jgi:hypothetical protein
VPLHVIACANGVNGGEISECDSHLHSMNTGLVAPPISRGEFLFLLFSIPFLSVSVHLFIARDSWAKGDLNNTNLHLVYCLFHSILQGQRSRMALGLAKIEIQ